MPCAFERHTSSSYSVYGLNLDIFKPQSLAPVATKNSVSWDIANEIIWEEPIFYCKFKNCLNFYIFSI